MDGKKVIKGLEEIQKHLDTGYSFAISWKSKLIRNTIELLKKYETMMQCIKGKCRICPHCNNCDVDENGLIKEQDAVEPLFVENPYTHLPVSYCPKCREPISKFITGNPYKETRHCHYCGQKVKWE